MAPVTYRDVVGPAAEQPSGRTEERGRRHVAVIGIDRYRSWSGLHNAVSDAKGAQAALENLGFEARRPLFDSAATGAALRDLVANDLRGLGTNDSLVVFFAGHGHTITTPYDDGTLSKRGYLVPVDADPAGGNGTGTWLSLDSWLRDIAHLPPKHILVILDACHSGIALDPVIRWRGEDLRRTDPLDTLRARRSRRIITSALDDQLALDSGPVPGHSLFTGCLIEALNGSAFSRIGRRLITGSEIGVHVQHRVSTYPAAVSPQTPDFGALELDNRGELIFELPFARPGATLRDAAPSDAGVDHVRPTKHKERAASTEILATGAAAAVTSGIDSISPKSNKPRAVTTGPEPSRGDEARPKPPTVAVDSQAHESVTRSVRREPPITESAVGPTTATETTAPRTTVVDPPARRASNLDPAFAAALDRHDRLRRTQGSVLTVVAADPMSAVTGWATWAAERGRLTLVTDGTTLDATVTSLLAQMPWLRLLPAARAALANTAKLDLEAVDHVLDRSRSLAEREAWIDDIARHDMSARVSGWLLSMVREPWAPGPEFETAPVQGNDLLAILCELLAPITVLLHHEDPTESWLERAVQTGNELVQFLPRQAVAIGAPAQLVNSLIRARPGSAVLARTRRDIVPLATRPPRHVDPARPRAEHVLHAALARDPRTTGLFEPNVRVPVHDHDRALEVDLVARDALLAIEIDDWYQSRDSKAYLRDRLKDTSLSRAQFFVMRFLAEDVEDRLEQTVNEIALGLAGRRASGSFVENAR